MDRRHAVILALALACAAPVRAQAPGSLLGVTGDLAGRAAESVANRAVDYAASGPVSTLEAVPGGSVIHSVVDGAAASLLKGESVDWTKTLTGASVSTVVGAVIAPECVVAGVALDVAAGWMSDRLAEKIEGYPSAMFDYAKSLVSATR